MNFSKIQLAGWRQFDSVELELHPRLTVITGANGAGKSTILRLFSAHFGDSYPFLATPKRSSTGSYEYSASLFKSIWRNLPWNKSAENVVGSLTYSNGQATELHVANNNVPQYSLQIKRQQKVQGIHFDSHRPVSMYKPLGNIPVNALKPETAFRTYSNEIRTRREGSHSQFSPLYRMKEAIISMAIFGEGNSSVKGNDEALEAFKGFQSVLRQILPESLGFERLDVRTPDIVLITRTGEFMIDAASGGIHTLIDLTWRLFMFSLSQQSFTVTFDEPENHLHPSLQKSLMQNLVSAFPNVQFIIATHSPFMVSSVKDSNVYVLRYLGKPQTKQVFAGEADDKDRRVSSELLDTVNKAGTASEILREVLGVSSTIPDWVATDLNAIVERYRNEPISDEILVRIRKDLADAGCEELYPETLVELTKGK